MLKRISMLLIALMAVTGCSAKLPYRAFNDIKRSGTLNVAVVSKAMQNETIRQQELNFIESFAASQNLTVHISDVTTAQEAFDKLGTGEADIAVGELQITPTNESAVTLSLPIIREDAYAVTQQGMPVFTIQDLTDFDILVVGQELYLEFVNNAPTDELRNARLIELSEAMPQVAYKTPTAVVLLDRDIPQVQDEYGQNVRIEHITNFSQFQYGVAMARRNFTVKSALDDYIYDKWEQSLISKAE